MWAIVSTSAGFAFGARSVRLAEDDTGVAQPESTTTSVDASSKQSNCLFMVLELSLGVRRGLSYIGRGSLFAQRLRGIILGSE